MAFTRPVDGADISAADFGQPVYDGIIRRGFSNMAASPVTVVPNTAKYVPVASSLATGNNPFTPNGDSSLWTCTLAGIYNLSAIIAAGGTAFPPGTYVAITRNSVVLNRMTGAAAGGLANGNGFVYETLSVQYTGLINVGEVIAMQVFSSGGGITMNNGGGTINDPQTPSFHVWRVSI